MKRRFWLYPSIIIGIFFISLAGCKKDTNTIFLNTITDYDGNVYHTLQIGTQTWMLENLIVTHYRNGASIANVADSLQWGNQTAGAYCIYSDSAYYVTNYGLLYNWYAAADTGIAPLGYHVAADSDWQKLIVYLGGIANAGGKMKNSDTTYWYAPNIADSSCGFNAFPCGIRSLDTTATAFQYINYRGYWWSASSTDNAHASVWYITGDSTGLYHDTLDNRWGLAIRCVKN